MTDSRRSPVAIVTGGGSGIGAATAAELSANGYRVVIAGRRQSALDRVAAATGSLGLAYDLTDVPSSQQLVDRVLELHGRLDCVVLNAGITREGPFVDTSDDDWAAMLSTNLVSAARLTRCALPSLVATRGSIVGVASVAALRVNTLMAGYSASKAGLVSFLQSVAVEYGPVGVRANIVCPGWVHTEMADSELGDIATQRGLTLDESYELATSYVPMRRAAQPAEIAGAIAFLASPAASYITGAVLPIDGGAIVTDAGALAL